MQIRVSIKSKKLFLHWLIHHEILKTAEINWFLEELLVDERTLSHVHFVSNIEHCPKGIIISTQAENKDSFLFFKGSIQTTDIYTAYHELHLYHEEPFYVQVTLPQEEEHPLYQA